MMPWRAGATLFRAEVLALARRRGELIEPLVFLLIVVSLFPLALGTRQASLPELAPIAVWIAMLLASCLALGGLFRTDYEDGMLDQLMLSRGSLAELVLAKVAAHWLLSGLPLVLMSILLGVLLQLPAHALAVLVLTLLIGTPILSLVGAMIMALSVGLQGGSTLPPLLLLPLYVPVLVFACGAVGNALRGDDYLAELYFLGGLLLLAVALTPSAVALCLRVRLCE